MNTSTTIYLITQVNLDGTSFPLITYFSESKAYRHVTELIIAGSEFEYDINQIILVGD